MPQWDTSTPFPLAGSGKANRNARGAGRPRPVPQVSGLACSSQGDSPPVLLWGIIFVSHQRGVASQQTYFPIPGLTLRLLFSQTLCANTFSPPRRLPSACEHLPAGRAPRTRGVHASAHSAGCQAGAPELRAPTRGRCSARGLTRLSSSAAPCVRWMGWQCLPRGGCAGHAVAAVQVPVEPRCPRGRSRLRSALGMTPFQTYGR